MQERNLESQVRKALRAEGAEPHKLAGGAIGDPDRIVVWTQCGEARVFYLELKTPTGRLSKVQKHRHAQLMAPVYVVRSVEEAIAALTNEKLKG